MRPVVRFYATRPGGRRLREFVPLDLPPLYDTVDPDAFDQCLSKIEDIDVSFEYANVAVTIGRTGAICLGEEAADPPSRERNRPNNETLD